MASEFGKAGSQTGAVKLNGTTSGAVTITVASAAGTWTLTLPTVDGDQGGLLSTNGSGVGKWSSSFGSTEYGLIGPGPIAGSGFLPGLNVGLNTSTYIGLSDATRTVVIATDGAASIGTFTNHDFLTKTNNTTRETLSAAGAFRWHTYGAGTLTTDGSGNITAVSDGRLKTDIKDLPCGLSEVLQLRPILHRWKPESGMDTENEYAGFIAQEVGKAMPCARYRKTRENEIEHKDEKGAIVSREIIPVDEPEDNKIQSYSLHAIVGALVKSVQELSAQIEELKKKV